MTEPRRRVPSAAVVTGTRVAAAMALDWSLRQRMKMLALPPLVAAGVLVVAGLLLRGVFGVLAIGFGLVIAGGVWLVWLAVRAALLRIRGLVAGADYDRVQPIVARHRDELRRAAPSILGGRSLLSLARAAGSPKRLSTEVNAIGESLSRLAPAFIAEVSAATEQLDK